MTYRAKTYQGQVRIFRAALGHLWLQIGRVLRCSVSHDPQPRGDLLRCSRCGKVMGWTP